VNNPVYSETGSPFRYKNSLFPPQKLDPGKKDSSRFREDKILSHSDPRGYSSRRSPDLTIGWLGNGNVSPKLTSGRKGAEILGKENEKPTAAEHNVPPIQGNRKFTFANEADAQSLEIYESKVLKQSVLRSSSKKGRKKVIIEKDLFDDENLRNMSIRERIRNMKMVTENAKAKEVGARKTKNICKT
jgi:hypothetical protein